MLAASSLHALTLGSDRVVRLWDIRASGSALAERDAAPLFGPGPARGSAIDSAITFRAAAGQLPDSCRQRLALSPAGDRLAVAAGRGGLALLPVSLAEGSLGPAVAGPCGGEVAELETVDWHPAAAAVAAGCSDGAVELSLLA